MLVDTARSSLTLVAPFLVTPEGIAAAAARFACATVAGRNGDIPVWQPARVDTDEWLPHIARGLAPDAPDAVRVGYAWEVTPAFAEANAGLSAKVPFEFVLGDARPVPLGLDAVQLILFRNGTGFVVLRWKVESESPADWLDVQHYARFADGRGRVLRKTRRTGKDQTERYFPDPFGGLAATADGRDRLARGEGTCGDLVRVALAGAGLGDGGIPVADVYLPGRLLPYNVLFLREADAPPAPDLPREAVLQKLRGMYHAAQPYLPSAAQAVGPPHFQAYLRDQWFFASLEGGGFVAVDAPPGDFFRHELPRHLAGPYFHLFVLALQQRFALVALSAEVSAQWSSNPGRSEPGLWAEFGRIRDRLFDFTARYYFAQVAQRENHHRCYRMWWERFGTAELYAEVCAEVRELSEYLQDRERHGRDRRVGRLTLLLTVLIGAPSLAIGFWNINVVGHTSAEGLQLKDAIGYVALTAGMIGSVFALVWAAARR